MIISKVAGKLNWLRSKFSFCFGF